MPSRTTTATPELPGTTAIRGGVALLAAIAFALSYDALRQMAVAIHIRGLLTYAFPLVIDGFIAIGVGALLMLRTAPLHSRIYVWALVGVATVTSIWANALHAVRLNQQTRQAASLRLDDVTVGSLSAIAPLALAGAVHLYLVIQRHPTATARQAEATPRHNHDAHEEEPPRPLDKAAAPANAASALADVAKSAPIDASPHAVDTDDVPDDLLSIARTAPPGRGGRASRRHIEDTIRANDLTIGRKEADRIKTILQAELDEAAQQQADPDQLHVSTR